MRIVFPLSVRDGHSMRAECCLHRLKLKQNLHYHHHQQPQRFVVLFTSESAEVYVFRKRRIFIVILSTLFSVHVRHAYSFISFSFRADVPFSHTDTHTKAHADTQSHNRKYICKPTRATSFSKYRRTTELS